MTTKTNEDWKYTLGGLLADSGISPSQHKIESKIWDCVYEAIKQETTLAVEKERERIREEIGNALWNKDGSLKSHDVSYIVSTIMHKTMSPHSDT